MHKTALLFAGQGAQSVGMGKDLADHFTSARNIFEQANQALGYDLASICFHGPEKDLTKTENAQPGIFLVSWVAFQLLRERCPSLTFQAAAGLSLGEFTALTAAEALSFPDGLRIVHERGRLMQEACDTTQGGMAAVIGLEEAAMRAVCEQAGVAVANLNCPGQIVISGASDRVTRACGLAKVQGAKRVLPLAVAGAYHSPLMASAQAGLESVLNSVELRNPSMTVLSNVTAQPHGLPAEIRRRLLEQVTASVRWEESIRWLLAQGFTRFIELGPGTALSGFMKRIDRSAEVLAVGDLASLEATTQAVSS
jgi:[acyl-carrier-protein] S-malonyltransferase